MHTIHISGIPEEQLAALDEFAGTTGPELREVLTRLTHAAREGCDMSVKHHHTLVHDEAVWEASLDEIADI